MIIKNAIIRIKIFFTTFGQGRGKNMHVNFRERRTINVALRSALLPIDIVLYTICNVLVILAARVGYEFAPTASSDVGYQRLIVPEFSGEPRKLTKSQSIN